MKKESSSSLVMNVVIIMIVAIIVVGTLTKLKEFNDNTYHASITTLNNATTITLGTTVSPGTTVGTTVVPGTTVTPDSTTPDTTTPDTTGIPEETTPIDMLIMDKTSDSITWTYISVPVTGGFKLYYGINVTLNPDTSYRIQYNTPYEDFLGTNLYDTFTNIEVLYKVDSETDSYINPLEYDTDIMFTTNSTGDIELYLALKTCDGVVNPTYTGTQIEIDANKALALVIKNSTEFSIQIYEVG